MNKVFEFMERPFGRGLRVALGVVLIHLGLGARGIGGRVVAVIGLLPIAMGLWGPCLLHLMIRRGKRA